MEEPSKLRPKTSYRSLEARREWRAEASQAVRRRELAERYPDINHQAWSNLGPEGYGSMSGAGARALREWLASVGALLPQCPLSPSGGLSASSPQSEDKGA